MSLLEFRQEIEQLFFVELLKLDLHGVEVRKPDLSRRGVPHPHQVAQLGSRLSPDLLGSLPGLLTERAVSLLPQDLGKLVV